MSRMNVLLIAVDDLRPAINAMGDARAITPHLDRFVNRSVAFTNAHCQQPICTASRACAMTGCRPDTTHVHQLETKLQDVRPDLPTLPRVFRDAGYRTISLGKVYHHDHDDLASWTTRIDLPQIIFPTHALPENVEQNRRWREAVARGDRSVPRAPAFECADLPDSAYSDFHLAAATIEQLKARHEAPFLIAAGFAKPHLPFTCPKRYWDLYDRDALARAVPSSPLVNPAPATVHNFGELRQYQHIPADPNPLDDAQRAELIHGYYACVSYLDAQIGKVLDAVESLGLADSTVIGLFADHGLILGEYAMWAKHTPLDAATRVPLILRDPRLSTNGQRCGRIVELIDLFPTLTELCDVPTPATVQGRSLAPLMSVPTHEWTEAAFSQFPRLHWTSQSVRTPRFRYTRWRERAGQQPDQRELYDFAASPIEERNVIDDPAYANDVAHLSRLLDAQHA